MIFVDESCYFLTVTVFVDFIVVNLHCPAIKVPKNHYAQKIAKILVFGEKSGKWVFADCHNARHMTYSYSQIDCLIG